MTQPHEGVCPSLGSQPPQQTSVITLIAHLLLLSAVVAAGSHCTASRRAAKSPVSTSIASASLRSCSQSQGLFVGRAFIRLISLEERSWQWIHERNILHWCAHWSCLTWGMKGESERFSRRMLVAAAASGASRMLSVRARLIVRRDNNMVRNIRQRVVKAKS